MVENESEMGLFDAYLFDEASDKSAFEKQLTIDPAFKARFEEYKNFTQAIEKVEILDFKANLNNWDKEKATKTTKIFTLKWVGIAASLILLFGLGYVFLNQKSPEDLLAANFTPYDNIITVRGEKVSIDDAMTAYQNKNYTAAIQIFESLPKDIMTTFYLGESYMAAKEYKKATEAFIKINDEESLFYPIAEYHLALAYLGLKDIENSKLILNKIEPTSEYYASAQDLLENL